MSKKDPLVKIISMDGRRAFMEELYARGFIYDTYSTAQKAWDYVVDCVGPDDTAYVYMGIGNKKISITSYVCSYQIVVNSPRQLFAYLARA